MRIRLILLFGLCTLLAGCTSYWASPPAGQAPPTEASAAWTPPVETPEPWSYPPPAGWTPPPTETPIPSETPTILPVPLLQAQPLAAEWGTGERIAFLKDGDLWLVRPDGNAQVQVTTSGNATALYGWSYDCTRLLVGVGERPVLPETDMPGGRDLWVVWADGHKAKPLVQGLEVLEARWSPVDERVAYGTREGNIYLINSDGTGLRTLLDNHTGFLGAWSPDGTKIAFARTLAPMDFWTFNIAILDVATGSVTVPTPEAKDRVDYRPYVWSTDGKWVLFQSDRGEGLWWRLEVESGKLSPLDASPKEFTTISGYVSKSPLADQIAFWNAPHATDKPAIWVMDLDGSNLRQLTQGANPTWSPDGKQVAYTDPTGALWVINLDGTGARPIAEADRNPLWYEPYWCR